MLIAFRIYYLAKGDFQQASLLMNDKKDQIEGKGKGCCNGGCRSRGDVDRAKRHQSMAARVGLGQDISALGDLEELKSAVENARTSLLKSKQDLRAACAKAKVEWSNVPRKPN